MIRTIFIIVTIALFAGGTNLYPQGKQKVTDTSSAIRPGSVKEIDQFHTLLYPLIHNAYPNKDFASIRKGLPGLVKAAETMAKAKLPAKKSIKKPEYKKETGKLIKLLKTMNKGKEQMSDEQLGKKFMEMHDMFEGIMEMME
jgi:hypothetical protein